MKKIVRYIPVIPSFFFFLFFLSSFDFHPFPQSPSKKNIYHITKVMEECDPENGDGCELFPETNPCDEQYEKCIEKCKDEICLNLCDKQYDECMENLFVNFL